MKPGFVDLHIHSTFSSDGDFTPAQLVEMAREHGFAAISISDHDSVAAYPEAVALGRAGGVEVVPSMEVTTLYEGREFHCLLPFLDWGHPHIGFIARSVSDGRWVEARERVDRLRRLGFDITWEEVAARAGETAPLGVTIAQILMDKPESRHDRRLDPYFDPATGRPRPPKAFYQDYFMEGRPAFVPKDHIGLLKVLELAPSAGAVPVLAHPGAYFENATRADLARLRDHGAEGLEVYTTYHDAAQTRAYEEAARDLGFVITAGSDFHGEVKPHVTFGLIRDGGYGMIEALNSRRRGTYGV